MNSDTPTAKKCSRSIEIIRDQMIYEAHQYLAHHYVAKHALVAIDQAESALPIEQSLLPYAKSLGDAEDFDFLVEMSTDLASDRKLSSEFLFARTVLHVGHALSPAHESPEYTLSETFCLLLRATEATDELKKLLKRVHRRVAAEKDGDDAWKAFEEAFTASKLGRRLLEMRKQYAHEKKMLSWMNTTFNGSVYDNMVEINAYHAFNHFK